MVTNEKNLIRLFDIAYDGYNGGKDDTFVSWIEESGHRSYNTLKQATADVSMPYTGPSLMVRIFEGGHDMCLLSFADMLSQLGDGIPRQHQGPAVGAQLALADRVPREQPGEAHQAGERLQEEKKKELTSSSMYPSFWSGLLVFRRFMSLTAAAFFSASLCLFFSASFLASAFWASSLSLLCSARL